MIFIIFLFVFVHPQCLASYFFFLNSMHRHLVRQCKCASQLVIAIISDCDAVPNKINEINPRILWVFCLLSHLHFANHPLLRVITLHRTKIAQTRSPPKTDHRTLDRLQAPPLAPSADGSPGVRHLLKVGVAFDERPSHRLRRRRSQRRRARRNGLHTGNRRSHRQ